MTSLEAIEQFVIRVNARAEAEMLTGKPLTGAHYRAMLAELDALHQGAAPAAVGREPHPELDLEAIERRLKKRRDPQIGTCSACGDQHEMMPNWQPVASSVASSDWICQQCGGGITVTVTIGGDDPAPDEDLAELIAEVQRLRSSSVPAAQMEPLTLARLRELAGPTVEAWGILQRMSWQSFNPEWQRELREALASYGQMLIEHHVRARASVPAATPEKEKALPDVPRRIQLDRFVPAERAIYDAMQAVEAMAADVRLTDAVVLLQAARDSVADYVEEKYQRRYVSLTPGVAALPAAAEGQ